MKCPITTLITFFSVTCHVFAFTLLHPITRTSLRRIENSCSSVVGITTVAKTTTTATATTLFAEKKKRRRRKDSTSNRNEQQQQQVEADNLNDDDDDDELPDFDFDEDLDYVEDSSKTTSTEKVTSTKASRNTSKTLDVNDPSVIAAMKATNNASASSSSSTRDLLRSRNRELEQKFVVDEVIQDVPSFADYNAKKGKSVGSGGVSSSNENMSSGLGKKAMRREQRRAAALEANSNVEKDEEDNVVSQLLSKLPFGNKDGDKEEKSAIKVRDLE